MCLGLLQVFGFDGWLWWLLLLGFPVTVGCCVVAMVGAWLCWWYCTLLLAVWFALWWWFCFDRVGWMFLRLVVRVLVHVASVGFI